VRADHETIELAVEDSGPGIPPEQLTRIFEPFFTTKTPGSGLGLGLSISSRIIDDLGGRLFAENRAEGGARFVIRLPRTRPAAASSIRRQENAPHA